MITIKGTFEKIRVLVKKAAPTFEEGKTVLVTIHKMTGRIYSPEKDVEGKWVDKVGKADNRIMVYGDWGNESYHVFQSLAEVNQHFEPVQ